MSLEKINVSKLSINVFYDSKSRSSFCWHYFGSMVVTEDNKRKIVNPDTIYCAACLAAVKADSEDVKFGSVKVASYSKKVSTGNLSRHLHTIHQIGIEKTRNKSSRENDAKPHFPSSQAGPSCPKLIPSKIETMVQDIVMWFCKSLIPFDSIADDGMVAFLKKYGLIARRGYLPSQSSVAGSALTSAYQFMLHKVKAKINMEVSRHCAISFDSWIDQRRKLNNMTFTLHYVTSNYELKSLTLSTQIISGKKTEEKINGFINDIKILFALDGKNIHAVTDTSTAVKRAASIQNMEYHLCLGHGLHNLVTEDGIDSVPKIKELVKKCKKFVMDLRYWISEIGIDSSEEQQEFCKSFEKLVETIENDDNEPISQNNSAASEGNGWLEEELPPFAAENVNSASPTRWHCILEMIEIISLIYKCDSINSILGNMGQVEMFLTQSEWTVLENLVIFLKKVRDCVEIVSSQKTCTINVALVFRCEIIDLLKSESDDEPLTISTLKRNMLKNIDNRFPVTKLVVASALLDKRFMALTEIDTYLESLNMTRASFLACCVKEIIKLYDLPDHNEMDMSANSGSATSFLNKLSKKHSSGGHGIGDDPVEHECWRYFASAAGSADMTNENLLSFWNEKKKEFPWISTFAKALLCIPATSIPCERIFTAAGLAFSVKRSRLSPYRLNKIIFIHDNYEECKIKVKK